MNIINKLTDFLNISKSDNHLNIKSRRKSEHQSMNLKTDSEILKFSTWLINHRNSFKRGYLEAVETGLKKDIKEIKKNTSGVKGFFLLIFNYTQRHHLISQKLHLQEVRRFVKSISQEKTRHEDALQKKDNTPKPRIVGTIKNQEDPFQKKENEPLAETPVENSASDLPTSVTPQRVADTISEPILEMITTSTESPPLSNDTTPPLEVFDAPPPPPPMDLVIVPQEVFLADEPKEPVLKNVPNQSKKEIENEISQIEEYLIGLKKALGLDLPKNSKELSGEETLKNLNESIKQQFQVAGSNLPVFPSALKSIAEAVGYIEALTAKHKDSLDYQKTCIDDEVLAAKNLQSFQETGDLVRHIKVPLGEKVYLEEEVTFYEREVDFDAENLKRKKNGEDLLPREYIKANTLKNFQREFDEAHKKLEEANEKVKTIEHHLDLFAKQSNNGIAYNANSVEIFNKKTKKLHTWELNLKNRRKKLTLKEPKAAQVKPTETLTSNNKSKVAEGHDKLKTTLPYNLAMKRGLIYKFIVV